MNPRDGPSLAGNNNEPDDVGQQNDALDGHMQPPIHAENRAGNDVQQLINNEDVNVPPDVNPLLDNVDHWVRRPTGLRRPLQRYNSSLQYIMLAKGVEALILKEARSYELKDCKGR